MDLSMVQLMQEQVEKLLRATKREGVEELISFLKEHNYYTLSCGSKHHRFDGGLSQYSVEVLLRMQKLNRDKLPMDSIVIVALLHEIYRIKEFPQYKRYGARSVQILTREAKFTLTEDEFQAILWQKHSKDEKGKLCSSFDAVIENPLWQLLRKAGYYCRHNGMSRYQLRDALTSEAGSKVTRRPTIGFMQGPRSTFDDGLLYSGLNGPETLTSSSNVEHTSNLADALRALVEQFGEDAVRTEYNRQMYKEERWPSFIKPEYRTEDFREKLIVALKKERSATKIAVYLRELDKENKTDFSVCPTRIDIYNELTRLIKPNFKDHTWETAVASPPKSYLMGK